jgi:NAD(P)-dependent dehydrogenase (short-subunit alcohol dehydrogenase family)
LGYDGKRAVVTGTASGMGRALTTLLVDQGAEVHAIDLHTTDAPVERSYAVDLADRSAVDDVVAAIPGPVDVLFNCAGLSLTAAPELVHRVNFLGLRRLTEGLLWGMAGGTAVANISSKAGQIWPAHLPSLLELVATTDDDEAEAKLFASADAMANAYGYSKAAVIVYTMARAAELVDRGIRMNCTMPGNTDTPMYRDHFVPAMPEAMKALSALTNREATAAEQAYALLFLNCPYASWVNGVALVVDGGSLAGVTTGRFTPPAIAAYANTKN